jgi:hypothetical protein
MKKILLFNLIMILGLALSAQANLFTPDPDDHHTPDEIPAVVYVNEGNNEWIAAVYETSVKDGPAYNPALLSVQRSEFGQSDALIFTGYQGLAYAAKAPNEPLFSSTAKGSLVEERRSWANRYLLNDGHRIPTISDFSIVSEVPEPAILFLLGAGLLVMAGFLRKRIVNKNSEEEME